MGIIEPVKKGFKVAGQSMNLVLALFVFGLFWSILNIFLTPQLTAPGTQTPTNPATTASTIIVGILFVLTSIFIQGGSLGFILEKIKTGNTSFSALLSYGGKCYVRLLLLGLIVALIVGFFVLLAGLAVALLSGNLNILGVIIAVIVGAIGIYFAVLLFLSPYAIVASDHGVMDAVKKSVSLVRSNVLSVLGIAIILIAIGFGFGVVLGVLLGLLSVAIKGIASQVIFAVLSSLLNAFLGTVVTAAFMSFYLELSAHNNTTGAS